MAPKEVAVRVYRKKEDVPSDEYDPGTGLDGGESGEIRRLHGVHASPLLFYPTRRREPRDAVATTILRDGNDEIVGLHDYSGPSVTLLLSSITALLAAPSGGVSSYCEPERSSDAADLARSF